MPYAGIQSVIRTNRFRSLFLIALLPGLLVGCLFLVFRVTSLGEVDNPDLVLPLAWQLTQDRLVLILSVVLMRGALSFWRYRWLIFSFSGAEPITRQQYPRIWNAVENLCISRGLPVPKIGIIRDQSMNAFALGRNPKEAWIVFSEGLVEKLTDAELQAVAGHELTHIINRDTLMMTLIVVYVGIIATLGEILMRTRSSSSNNKKGGGQIILVGLVLYLLGSLVFPLVQLAISRKREFLADAGSVQLTKDKNAMISALQKISQDSRIESIQKQTIAAMCIESPFSKSESWSHLRSTHPPLEQRIRVLEAM